MTVMNKQLQKHQITEMLNAKGIDPATVDLEALVDPELSLPENIVVVANAVGAKLYNGEQPENMSNRHIEDEVRMTEENNREEFTKHVAEPGSNPGEFTVKDKVLKLLRDKPGYKAVLESMVKHENKVSYPNSMAQGWKISNVFGLSGGHLTRLLQHGIIKRAYMSDKYKEFRLVDKSMTEEALEEFEMVKAETVSVLSQWSLPRPTKEDVEGFKEILAKQNGLNYWAPFVNPKVSMMGLQKKAALLTLVSLDDRYGDRHRIHMLLYGEPGTAKSEIREWVSYKLGIPGCSHRSSDVGLTGDARGPEITPGALPRSHKGVLTIDELDKFDKRDQFGLLECMSEGVVTITAGKNQTSFPAETRIIACANNLDVLSPELLDRFDFLIECKNPPKAEGKNILTDILESWGRPKEHYSGRELGKFLSWVRDFEPYISDEVRKRIIELVTSYIEAKNIATVKVRQYEKIMRIALAIARLNHRDLQFEDAVEAIRLIDREFDNHYKLMHLQESEKGGEGK